MGLYNTSELVVTIFLYRPWSSNTVMTSVMAANNARNSASDSRNAFSMRLRSAISRTN